MGLFDKFSGMFNSINVRNFFRPALGLHGPSIELLRIVETARIEPIAEGRVWSGYDGKTIGLVDQLGGLEVAIRIAKQKAGIAPGDEGYRIGVAKEDITPDYPIRLNGFGVRRAALIEEMRRCGRM